MGEDVTNYRYDDDGNFLGTDSESARRASDAADTLHRKRDCNNVGIVEGRTRPMRRLSYRHVKRLDYYCRGFVHHLKPTVVCWHETARLLEQMRTHPDHDELEARAGYYNKLTGAFDAAKGSRIIEIERCSSRYFLDLNEHAKGFGPGRRLWYKFGDITKVPRFPTVVKSRPICLGNENSVILNLDKIRHFTWADDPLPFRNKKPSAVWRGTPRTKRRRLLVERFYDHPVFDIGHSNGDVGGRRPKCSLTHDEQKRFKFFLSLEGKDVATNLKWSMASNMLVMSPALRFETWYMEGALEPGRHFVLLEDDFRDLEDKVAYYTEHVEEAEEIILNAHAWLDRFADPLKERMIAARVLEKYFQLSEQL